MIVRYKEREVELEFYGWGNSGDDIQCSYAVYVDDGSEVDENDIDDIMNQYADKIHQRQYENMASRAYDDWKDRD